MSESALMITLRLIHIIAGVFWGGAAMVAAWFILPAQRALGPSAMPFMNELMMRQRLRTFALSAMVLTILSGLTMYARMAMITHGMWARSTMGMVLGVGAITGLIAGGIGGGVVSTLGKKMMAIGAAMQAAGGTPTETQRTEMQLLQAKMARAYRATAILLLITIAAMASARYL